MMVWTEEAATPPATSRRGTDRRPAKRSALRNAGLAAAVSLGIVGGTQHALAASESGEFAIEGVGRLNCTQFLEEQEKVSDVYARLIGWVEGYTTAANQYEKSVYDVTPWQGTGIMTVIIQNHCQANPNDGIFTVVQALIATFIEDAMGDSSIMIELSDGEQDVALYQEVLRQAQVQLASQGLFDGVADGEFGADTRSAIEAFQSRQNLDVTGMPDQQTLWRLFLP